MKNSTRILGLLGALATAGSLLATMDDQKAFSAKYPDAKALAKCATCHTAAMPKKGAADLNGYGKDLKEKGGSPIDFAKVEALDSDGDGAKNIDEIKAGTNPGAK